MARTAALLIIGNEILTGKIQDANVAYLARELFDAGVSLRRVVVCPDEVEIIASDINALREAHDVVITSGGVGPTHDDVTLQGVALAFGKRLQRSDDIARMLRTWYGDRITDDHLRMADVPEGADLVQNEAVPWPTVLMGNVYVFPGVPELLQLKFPVVRERIRGAAPFVSRAVYVQSDEGEIASALEIVARSHPTVLIGSYLRWRDPERRLKLTVDGNDASAVERAVADLVRALGDKVVD